MTFTIKDMVRMAAGNPGAARVVREMSDRDPESLCLLEKYRLAGENVWVLFKDICDEDIDVMIRRLACEPDTLLNELRASRRGYRYDTGTQR